IYVLVSFTFFKGIFTKYYRLIALSLLVVFLYGSMIWYVFPIVEGVSWEGHTAGLITGFLFALIFKKEIAKPKKYVWEEQTFNEQGKFIEFPETNMEVDTPTEPLEENRPTIHYTFKPNKDTE